ncbi:MAG TPA: class I SAM-dependent methyltransferase [Candidatus Competibacteraceae bacterium]|nr:MAG: class I SAM-dependent methyltransferase [Candidatus Competibacteraceae bacterium]HQC71146.1 class I SAM-dependent methyltransferase [Candidatus Competibacteraceae bacterium]
MTREEKILQHIDKNGLGIEIGPSHNPLAPKSAGYRVHIIDHMSREQLITKYAQHGVDLNRIEEVDFIWHQEPYTELTGKNRYYDWIIASHVIEHMPDLIGFINNCDEVLKEDGVLSLVVPDKRYCFDHYRPMTSLATIVDHHIQNATYHTAGAVAEYFLNVVSRSGAIAWDARTTGHYAFVHSAEDVIRGMQSVLNDHAYLDIHAWCFTPHSFRLLMQDLFALGLIQLREVAFYPTAGCEFYMTLGRKGKGSSTSRMELLDIIETEIREG